MSHYSHESRASKDRCLILPRDAMHKRGLCRHAVSVRPSIRHVRGLSDYVETNKYNLQFFLTFG